MCVVFLASMCGLAENSFLVISLSHLQSYQLFVSTEGREAEMAWMLLNKLETNLSFLRYHLYIALSPPLSHLDERGLASPKAGNIGIIFDEYLSMVPQVTAMCKSAFYHFRLIRKPLTFDAAQLLVHALITSKLDYCNSLLYGLPKHACSGAAARIISLSPKV